MVRFLRVLAALVLTTAVAHAQSRDSQVRVDDNTYGVIDAGKMRVTPQGGSQTTLGAALAASGCTTNCTLTNPTISGGSFSGGAVAATSVNNTSAAGYQIGGVTAFNITTGSNASVMVGALAGASLTPTSVYDTFVGYGSGQNYNPGPNTALEVSCFGTASCANLSPTAAHVTGIGVASLYHATTDSGIVSVGGDNMRNTFAIGGTSVGSFAHSNWFGTSGASFGNSALAGNAAGINITGTATAGDVVSVTFTFGSGTSPWTASYTVQAGDTLVSITSGLGQAISNGNQANGGDIFSMYDAADLPGIIGISHSGTATISNGTLSPTLTVTSSVTGAHTETMAISGGVVRTANNVFAFGDSAIAGYQATTATDLVAFGRLVLASVTTAQDDACGGNLSCERVTTGSNIAAWGYNSLNALTTGFSIAALGSNTGATCTTCFSDVFIGSQAGSTATTASSMVIVGSGAGQTMTTDQDGIVIGSGAVTAAHGTQTLTSVGYGCLQSATSVGSLNTILGACDTSYGMALSGSKNTIIGADAEVPSGSGSSQLSIMNAIYGISLSGTLTTPSAGRIGIMTQAPNAALTIGDGAGAGDAHLGVLQTTAPTITSGTATLDAHASDVSGTVTEGTAQTGFTLTFHAVWQTVPHCTVSSPNGVTFTSYTPAQGTLTIANASATGDVFSYVCVQ
jgi:hypothetical protein